MSASPPKDGIPLEDITISWTEIGPTATVERQVTGAEIGRILSYIEDEGGLSGDALFWDARQNALFLAELGDLLCEMVNHGLEHAGGQLAIGEQIRSLSRRISVEPMRHAVVTVRSTAPAGWNTGESGPSRNTGPAFRRSALRRVAVAWA
jgi:hypothetical protein